MNPEEVDIKGHKMGHHDREDIIGERKFSDIGQLIFLVLFLVLWVLDSFVFQFSTFLTAYIPIYISAPIGGVILLLAGFLAFKAHQKVFDEIRDPPEVITTGVFKYVRHPMYLGAILLFLGLNVITLSLASLGLFVIIVIFYEYIARYEEKLLIANFGEDYENYKTATRRWLLFPRFRKKEN
ncbi:MAG: isoprenylcysteine carboxylmethyltransferase family protein [Candidatus Heimdallarchaeota archaeon]|nr:isoprenylcysteine carboxylmethyltransferase family protein [Candidatus Heimdallarchaeota archaeon]